MTTQTGRDRDDVLREAIEEALLPGAPGEEERREWAREALARASTMPPIPALRGRRRFLLVGLAAAAAVLVAAIAILGPRVGWHEADSPELFSCSDGGPERDAQRAVNEAALASAEVRARLAEAAEGTWAVIALGRIMALAPDAETAIADFKKVSLPERVSHAFVFRVGTEGDVEYETTWPYEQVAGNAFMAEADLTFATGEGGARFWREDTPPPKLENALRGPAGDGRPILPVTLTPIGVPVRDAVAPTPLLVATGYGGPLILPDSYPTVLLPEIPGRATVRDMFGGVRTFRRLLVHASIEKLGLDTHTEALGDLAQPPAPLSLGGVDWPRFRPDAREESVRTGRPLLLLVLDVSAGVSIDPFEAPRIREMLEGFTRGLHVIPWEDPAGLDGAPFTKPCELVTYFPPGDPARDFEIGERLTLDVVGAGRLQAFLGRALSAASAGLAETLVFRIDAPPSDDLTTRTIRMLAGRFADTKVRVETGDSPGLVRIEVPARAGLSGDEVVRIATMQGELRFHFLAEDGDSTTAGPLDLAREAERRTEEGYEPPVCEDPDYPTYAWFPHTDGPDGERWSLVRVDRWGFSSSDIGSVSTARTPQLPRSGLTVSFGIRPDRQSAFGEFTGRNSDEVRGAGRGRRLAVIFDGRIVKAPAVRSRLTGEARVEGGFSSEEARALALVLQAGRLGAPLKLVNRR